MKYITFLLLLCCLCIVNSLAQKPKASPPHVVTEGKSMLYDPWEPEIQLTKTPAKPNGEKKIAVSGNLVHFVWQDIREGSAIYYKRSTNGGESWEAEVKLTGKTVLFYGSYVTLIASGKIVNVFWIDVRNKDANGYQIEQIYYKRSLDGGTTWSPDTKLTNPHPPSRPQNLLVTVSGSYVHLVWRENRMDPGTYTYLMPYSIYYKRSTDGGFSWGADVKMTSHTAEFPVEQKTSNSPALATNGQVVHLIWSEGANENTGGFYVESGVYYKRSTDGGSTWGADTKLAELELAFNPSIAASSQGVQVFWANKPYGTSNILHKRSPDGGISWRSDSRLTNDSLSSYPQVAVASQIVHLVFWREGTGVVYKKSINGGISWGVDTKLTSKMAGGGDICVSGEDVHVIWGNNERQVFYRRMHKKSIKNDRPIQQNTTSSVVSKVEEKVEETSENKIDGNDSEKWVITPSGAKGATGTVSINIPEGVEWHLDIRSSDNKALGKWDDKWNNKKIINLIPGLYNIFFTYVPVPGVPIQKGMNTRLKAGLLNVVTTGQWQIWNEEKTKVHVVYYKPSKIALPVGRYNIQLAGQYHAIEIKEGEVTEF